MKEDCSHEESLVKEVGLLIAIKAYDWVTSGSLSYWTGCTIVGLAGTAYTASNNSAHRFVKIKNNATVTGDASASFQYRCNAQ